MRDGPDGGSYGIFGFEFYADPNDPLQSYVTWVADGVRTHTVYGTAIGPDTNTQIGPRLVAAEPMVRHSGVILGRRARWLTGRTEPPDESGGVRVVPDCRF